MNPPRFRLPLSRLTTALATGAIVASAVGIGSAHHHRVRARCRCGIPCRDYQQATPGQPPARAVSTIGMLLRSDPTPAAGPGGTTTTAIAPAPPTGAAVSATASSAVSKIRYYQLDRDTLPIEQCSIARVAMLLEQNGHWRISLQADQNPKVLVPPGLTAPTAPSPAASLPQKQTIQIRRNLFYVVVRGYGAYQNKDAPDATTPGKPLLFRFEMEPFWVQNGVPRDMVWDGCSADVQNYFDLVDRIEIDFSYR